MKIVEQEVAWYKNARVRKLAGGFKFAEGPVWHPDQYFLFSDTPSNKIYQLFINGTIKVFLHNSGLTHRNIDNLSDQIGSNGLALGIDNSLFICQHGNHAIAVLNDKKEISTVINGYNKRPFNSPNDIIVKSDGSLYFTDPPYGLREQVLHPENFQPHAGIYRYNFREVELLSTDLKYPNGIVFSPNEQLLYVGSNHPDEKTILKYFINEDGTISYAGILIEENADGMTIDSSGNIYLAVKNGILVVSPQGERLTLIEMNDTPTNVTWGAKADILFVTAASSIYFIER